MSVNPVAEQIRLYAKQLKTPTFGDYNEIPQTYDTGQQI